MVYVVNWENRHLYASELDQMFQSRYETFIGMRRWDLDARDGREIDDFDTDDTIYLIDSKDGIVNSSARLISTEHPTIINTVFPHLCSEEPPCSSLIWESSRGHLSSRATDPFAWTRVMLAQLEFSLLLGVEEVVFVVDTFLLPKWVSAGWNLKPLGPPTEVDGESYIACSIKVSSAALRLMRDRYQLTRPVLTYIADVPEVA
ncbi:MAG: hypothetical protein EP340_00980 [Alphaproteobacteria bacterium]|nr:MAG: hypothetical protein EP340_00980 [Alphaproteobacteria bacterium]